MRRKFAYVAFLPCLSLARDEVLACDNAALEYMGTGWSGVAVDVKKLPNGGDAHVRNSLSTNSAVEVTFTGTGLAWRGWRASNQGTVNIDIDGVRTDSADAHEDGIDPIDSPLDVVTLWSIRGLPNEQHVVKFNHGGASDTYLWIYQFISTIPEPPPPSPPPAPRPPPPSSSPSPAPSPPPARPTSTTTSREEPSSSSTSSSDAPSSSSASSSRDAPSSAPSSFSRIVRSSSSVFTSNGSIGFTVIPIFAPIASFTTEPAPKEDDNSGPSGKTIGMAAGGIGACLAGLVLLAFCYTSRRNRRLEVERSARQEQDYARGLALWSELKTLAAASSSGSGGSSKSPHAFGNLIDKSPAYAMSPIARLAYDPSSPSANNDKEDDLESEGSYSLDGTKRHPPPPLHARNKSYAESFVDPDAAAMELKHSLTEKSSWKRRLPSSQAIMQLGADAPPVPPMPTGANKQAWVGQWAAAQVPPSELGPIDRSSRLTEMDARKTIGALTMALDGDDEDERSDAQTSVSRRVRVPPVSPTDVHQDVPIDMDDERSVRDTVWL